MLSYAPTPLHRKTHRHGEGETMTGASPTRWRGRVVCRMEGLAMRWLFRGFKDFIFRGNVVDLAVGFVIGAAFSGLVQSFVKDLITPIIGIAGGFNFFSWSIPINKSNF